jgi:hypothetical protein
MACASAWASAAVIGILLLRHDDQGLSAARHMDVINVPVHPAVSCGPVEDCGARHRLSLASPSKPRDKRATACHIRKTVNLAASGSSETAICR